MSTVISVEHLSKRYRLGTIGAVTLREDVQRWWHRLRGLPDPTSRVDLAASKTARQASMSDELWALRDVSFEVRQGEVLGIIGRNGAGKSTLLKILSRVTAPTRGAVRLKGRIASLLEVGTGFHPELTGRENIFLNGAILGMTKEEVRSKLDQIIDFSGVERFIDTPVKRYSSGMYVRLAFAVAAHLEPEILIVDEVLAVGDAEFQKKCLGKMGEVSRHGRTVLFVSHNMVAVQSLCSRAVWLKDGTVCGDGIASEIVSKYLRGDRPASWERTWSDESSAPGSERVRLCRVSVAPPPGSNADALTMQSPLCVQVSYRVLAPDTVVHITLHFCNEQGLVLFTGRSGSAPGWALRSHAAGRYNCICTVPAHLMNSGYHSINVLIVEDGNRVTREEPAVVGFDIVDAATRDGGYMGREPGVVQPTLMWTASPQEPS